MKIAIALVYALEVILDAECRLRQEDTSEAESISVIGKDKDDSSSSEPETLHNIYEEDQTKTVIKEDFKDLWAKERLKEQMEREKAAGSYADALAPNQHYAITNLFKDLGRRFVPQYPYYEKQEQDLEDQKAEDYLHKEIQDSKARYERENLKLLPVKASPELVLSVARQSKALEDSKTVNPADDLINKQILRSGDYWNDVWKEDVEPNILRTGREKLPLQDKIGPMPKLGSVRTKIMPGTKLYQLISVLKQVSPKLLYVMNVN